MNQRLKERRKAAGLTLEQLANAVGVCTSAVCLYESYKRIPDGFVVREIMRVLGVDDPAEIGYTLTPAEKARPAVTRG